jgi:polyisoprenoid-binding protein YceI
MILSTLLLLGSLQSAPPALGLARYEPVPEACVVGFDGKSTLHDFTGRAETVYGTLRSDLDHVDTTSAGEFWIESKTLKTGDSGRDEAMLEHLDAEHFPELRFKFDSVRGQLDRRAGTLQATGLFTIKDIARERTFPVSIERAEGGQVHVQGRVAFDMRDHGIAPPDKVVISMDAVVTVWFDLTMRPVAATPVEATRIPLLVQETIEIAGQPAVEVQRNGALWTSPKGSLWERPDRGELIVAQGDGLHIIDVRSQLTTSAAPSAEASFAESRARLASLREKLEGMDARQRARAGAKLELTIKRLELAETLAPTPGPAQVQREGELVRISLGGVEWARLEGLAGDAGLGILGDATEDLPAAVRAALGELPGTPKRMTLRTANSSGVRTTTYTLGEPVLGTTPDWVWAPAAWTQPKEDTQ